MHLAVRQKRTAGNVYFRKEENAEHSHICISRISRMGMFVRTFTPENFSRIMFITYVIITTHIASLNRGFHINDFFFACIINTSQTKSRIIFYV